MVELARRDRDAIVAHAQRDYPNECCGLLIGGAGRVQRVSPMANAEHSPVAYRVDPHDLLKAFLELDESGLELVGIYHSHTHSPAYPSPTDVRYAGGYPEAVHLIVSLADRDSPSLRAFRITDGQIAEEEVVLR